MEKMTEFDYLLNRLEHAANQEKPAEHHYGTHRASLIRHVRDLERDAERYRWLRAHHWNESRLCAVMDPKGAVRLGRTCPSGEYLDIAVDDEMQAK